jgi:predicted esterase
MNPHAGEPLVAAGAPLGESPVAMIMVHGRNAAPANILELVPRFSRPTVTYLAPSAADRSWYPYSFMANLERNEPGLSSGLWVLARLVDEVVQRGVRKDHLLLLGFSQGACLTAEFALRHPARYGGILVYSGGLIGPPGTVWTSPRDGFEATPVFFGCSDVDGHVPKARVDESADVFTRMGAVVTERIYPGMGHLVNDDEVTFGRALMDGLLQSS